jgi:hypothetical protein
VAGRRALDRRSLARKLDRGARAGLAMLAARATYKRLRRGSKPSASDRPAPGAEPDAAPIVDDRALARLREELADELERHASRDKRAEP